MCKAFIHYRVMVYKQSLYADALALSDEHVANKRTAELSDLVVQQIQSF